MLIKWFAGGGKIKSAYFKRFIIKFFQADLIKLKRWSTAYQKISNDSVIH